MAMATATALAIGGMVAPLLGQTGGAIAASRANSSAQRHQDRAATEAMLYQARKDKQARDDYRFQYNAWRDQFYGGKNGTPTGAMANTGVTFNGAAPAAGAAPAGLAGFTGAAPAGAATMAGAPAAPVLSGGVVPEQQPRTLADMGPWSASNFGQYLGRR